MMRKETSFSKIVSLHIVPVSTDFAVTLCDNKVPSERGTRQTTEEGTDTAIYIDVLFCVNFMIDYVMLLSVKKLLSFDVRRRRLLLGALSGAFGSLAVLLPPLPFGVSLLLSMTEAFVMVLAAFAPTVPVRILKGTLTLFAVSFLYCGIMTAILSLLSPQNLMVRNSVVYIGISPLALIVLTVICYGLFRLYYSLKSAKTAMPPFCQVRIQDEGRPLSVKGLIDTGHLLHEPFSGECVIICRRELFSSVPSAEDCLRESPSVMKKNFRMIPFSSVGGSGLLPAFRPTGITILLKNKEIKVSAYIALSNEMNFTDGCDCIVPAELIRKGC